MTNTVVIESRDYMTWRGVKLNAHNKVVVADDVNNDDDATYVVEEEQVSSAVTQITLSPRCSLTIRVLV